MQTEYEYFILFKFKATSRKVVARDQKENPNIKKKHVLCGVLGKKFKLCAPTPGKKIESPDFEWVLP